jgi:biopolymer transport protein ExbD
MRFTTRKRRQAPAVIIISLIDILIVLLIFLMVTSTFKQFPAVKLTLPEAGAVKEGSTATNQTLVVTISKSAPHFYLNTRPVTLTKLQEELIAAAARNTNAVVAVRGDKEAQWEQVIQVIQAANAAKIRNKIEIFVQNPKK